LSQVKLALQELHQAEQNFEYAEPAFVQVATYELQAKKEKFSELIKKEKAAL